MHVYICIGLLCSVDYLFSFMYVCMYVCTYLHMYICTYVHIYISYIHIYIWYVHCTTYTLHIGCVIYTSQILRKTKVFSRNETNRTCASCGPATVAVRSHTESSTIAADALKKMLSCSFPVYSLAFTPRSRSWPV